MDRNRLQQREHSPRSPSRRSPPPASPDRELAGVRRGFRGRPDLLDFSCTLRPNPRPPVHHVRPLTPPRQERQAEGASSAGPQSEPMENLSPWHSLRSANSHFRIKFGCQHKDRNHKDLDEPFPNLNVGELTEERRRLWKGFPDCERILTAPHIPPYEPELPEPTPKPSPEPPDSDTEPKSELHPEPPPLLTDSEAETEPVIEPVEEPTQLLEPDPDKFPDIDQYIHDIDETDNPETVEAKQAFNDALISNTELELLHRENIEHGSGSTMEDIWTLRRD